MEFLLKERKKRKRRKLQIPAQHSVVEFAELLSHTFYTKILGCRDPRCKHDEQQGFEDV